MRNSESSGAIRRSPHTTTAATIYKKDAWRKTIKRHAGTIAIINQAIIATHGVTLP